MRESSLFPNDGKMVYICPFIMESNVKYDEI